MNRSIKALSIGLCIILIWAAGFMLKSNRDTIKFYVLKSGKNSITREKILVFDEMDIESYDWDSHIIIFTKDFLERDVNTLQEDSIEGGSRLLDCNANEVFVVYINNKKIYQGIVEPPLYQSFLPGGPIISDIKNGIKIEVHYGEDLRSSQEVYNALRAHGLILNQ